ncbi:MAG: hypothetical protein QOD57_4345 [Actinomycetota bacterium]|nr:hypothetical protein [Actinomycetota bacterium]
MAPLMILSGGGARRRFRALVAVVAVTAVGTTAAVLRSDAGPGGRTRHGSVASPAAGPTSSSAGSGFAGESAVSGVAAPSGATSSAAGPESAPATPRTTTTGAGGTAPAPAPAAGKLTPATRPAGAAAAVGQGPDEAPGWRLLPKAPIGGRVGQDAVWTGREMVIWGGESALGADPLADGAAFDPASRTWRKLPAAPIAPRFLATMVWTGREVIVFGGTSGEGDLLVDGAAWDPASNAWRRLPASPAGPRDGAVVAWAGDRLVVWGGATVEPAASEMRADGAAYVPGTDRWVPVAAAPIPARTGAESVWTGRRLVISGGYHDGDDGDRSDGAALDPVSGVWSPIASRPAPGSCGSDVPCDGRWTGTLALFPASGLRYDPVGDRWSTLAPYPSAARSLADQPAVWTGQRLLAWGTPNDVEVADGASTGAGSAGEESDSGSGGDGPPPPAGAGMYDPVADRWQAVAAGPLSGRVFHTAVWTGQEMLVWGGTAGDAGLADGASYRF